MGGMGARSVRAAAARAALSMALALAWGPDARALETDQYFAWTKPLEDATAAVNAKVNKELLQALRDANEAESRRGESCYDVSRRAMKRFRFFIFQDIQLWVDNAPFVDRVPGTPEEELAYRRDSLYPFRGLRDVGMSIPPSPTIEIDGIRIGTDKLSHFFSNGWRYYRRYLRHARRGQSTEEAEAGAIGPGVWYEKNILGYALSGVFSIGDMEANYKGLLFFRSLCDGEAPRLVNEGGAWRLARPFDIREFVTPEWDESYRPSVYSPGRWRRVRRIMRRYCPLLDHPDVVARRADYARRDRVTETDRLVDKLVKEGRIADPSGYAIDTVCAAASSGDPGR